MKPRTEAKVADQVVELLSDGYPRASSDIARELGRPKPSIRRVLFTMLAQGHILREMRETPYLYTCITKPNEDG